MPSNRNYGKASRHPCCFMRFVATKVKHLIWQELKVQTTSSFWANCVLEVCGLVFWTSTQIAIETGLWMVVRFLGQPTVPMVAGTMYVYNKCGWKEYYFLNSVQWFRLVYAPAFNYSLEYWNKLSSIQSQDINSL